MSHNRLQGPIPLSIGNLTALLTLYVSALWHIWAVAYLLSIFKDMYMDFRIKMAFLHLKKILICLEIACELIESIICARAFTNFVEI